jgi:hypothetical protein
VLRRDLEEAEEFEKQKEALFVKAKDKTEHDYL